MKNGKWKMENGILIEPTLCVNSVLSSELTTTEYSRLSLRPGVLYTTLPGRQPLFSTHTRHTKLHTQCNTHHDSTETAPKHRNKKTQTV